MKILIATTDRLTTRGGEQFLCLAEHLADAGHDTVLVSPDGRDQRRESDGRTVTSMRWPSAGANRIADGVFLWRLLRRFKPECVVGRRAALNWTMTLGRVCGVRRRIAWDDTLLDQWVADLGRGMGLRLKVLRRRFVYRCATCVIAVSAAAVERLRTGYGLDPARCRVLLNAVLDHGPRTSDPTGDRFEAVCIGRLERSKDHALVLEAVARMCPSMRDRCHMRIIGEGRERKHLEEMIGRLGLGATVELAGNLPEDVVLAGLSRADVFVHPSTIDNCPFVILEALSLGVPIIATRVGGIPELIEDGQEGLLIDKRDVAALIEALETLVTKPDLRSALGSRGRRRFLSEFEMSGWVERAAALVLEDLPTT